MSDNVVNDEPLEPSPPRCDAIDDQVAAAEERDPAAGEAVPANDGSAVPAHDEGAAPIDDGGSAPAGEEVTAPAGDEAEAPVHGEVAASGDNAPSNEAGAPVDEESGAPNADESSAPVDDESCAPADDESSAPVDGENSAPVDGDTLPPDTAPVDTVRTGDVTRAHLKGLIEALVFVSDHPVSLAELAKAAKAERKLIKALADELRAEYASRGIRLDEVAGGFVFRTSAVYAPFVRDAAARRPVRMTRAQIETLAIIAYRQPLTRPEVDEIRGVDSGATLKMLLERDLVKILGKKDEPGRPLLYGTTPTFLEFFGLKSLKDMPPLREFTELSEESRRVYEEEMGDEAAAGNAADYAASTAGSAGGQAASLDAERLSTAAAFATEHATAVHEITVGNGSVEEGPVGEGSTGEGSAGEDATDEGSIGGAADEGAPALEAMSREDEVDDASSEPRAPEESGEAEAEEPASEEEAPVEPV